jgi:hypothetical protein
MAMEQHPVQLAGVGGCSQGVFTLEEGEGDLCRLRLQYPGGEVTAEAFDFFEALCQVRRELEKVGWRPVCYGSSKAVYPSGMCREMGSGLKAYRLQLGQPARVEDLVSIFESGPDVEPASVEEQRAFHDLWMRSVGAGR